MGWATRLGPMLLGTVKDTTSLTGVNTQRNVGLVQAAQVKVALFGDTAGATAFVLPAGSLILSIQAITTTAFTGTTLTNTLSIGATAVTAALTVGAVGTSNFAAPATAGAAALWNNVGTTDAVVTYTFAGVTAGAQTLVIEYLVRDAVGNNAPLTP